MGVPVAVIAAWVALADGVVSLINKLRGKGSTTPVVQQPSAAPADKPTTIPAAPPEGKP